MERAQCKMPATLEEIFHTSRFTLDFGLVSLILYTPLGIALTIIRIFVTMNYFCCQVLLSFCFSPTHPVQHFVQRIFLWVLGIVVYKENETNLITKPTNSRAITVCNRVMNIDEYAIPAWLNALVTTKNFTLSAILQNLLRKFPCRYRQHFQKLYESENTVVVHFPEDCPSSGRSLLKFHEWIFSLNIPIQPCCVKITRFLPIKPSVVDSSFLTDLLCCFFCPITIYKVKVLPVMHRSPSESSSQFAIRVQKRMAHELKIARTSIVQGHRDEFIKIRNVVARQQLNLDPPSLPDKYYPEDIKTMVGQVKEVIDKEIPFSVIAEDLFTTDCAETTITNILEERVKYVPSKKAKSEKDLRVFENSPSRRQMSFNERKRLFIQEARDKYLQKHPEYKKNV